MVLEKWEKEGESLRGGSRHVLWSIQLKGKLGDEVKIPTIFAYVINKLPFTGLFTVYTTGVDS